MSEFESIEEIAKIAILNPSELTSREVQDKVDAMSEEELSKLKVWIFSELIRLEEGKKELKEHQDRFIQDKVSFNEEMRALNQKIVRQQARLKQDEQFFQKKMDILQSGFAQLDNDRQKLNDEKRKFERQKENFESGYQSSYQAQAAASGAVFFRGVTNLFTLKKRYKDLIKLYHPDNLAGDKDTACLIREEYEMLKEKFERNFSGFGT
ncbi:MAG: hypothetical protein K5682_04170 [Lachnospiraceae bacterium]|nr:hypothetical protein [Lachnospiraceae bacterium]